jgi:hypothetical protein
MKRFLIFTLLSLLSLFGYSQNGGQFFENNVIKVFYLGYSFGEHTFRVCNKQSCEARIRTKADQDPAVDVQVKPDSCVIVKVFRPNPGNIKFRAKAETSCPSFTNPDMGWLELNTADFVLHLVEGNNIVVIRGPYKLDISINGGILKSSYGSINYIEHIRVYSILGEVKYNEVTFARRSNITDLNNYLKAGLNIVEVIIVDNNTPERFIFKVRQAR